jgi:hypothetical protein
MVQISLREKQKLLRLRRRRRLILVAIGALFPRDHLETRRASAEQMPLCSKGACPDLSLCAIEHLVLCHARSVNLTATNRLSVQTTSQSRFALPSLNQLRVNWCGNSVIGCATARRAPSSEISQIRQFTNDFPLPKLTVAARRAGRRMVFRCSRRWLSICCPRYSIRDTC